MDSLDFEKQLVAWRRYLHQHAETGFALDNTTAFIQAELTKMGYEPKKCGKAGVVASVGKGKKGKAFLLRADMDALPMQEKTGLPFACDKGAMHACGHDMHAAMLLGAAKLLKEKERALKGEVKLLFQPAEEILEGAKDVIENGALDGVAAAMTTHVMTNVPLPVGTVVVGSKGVGAPAADYFRIQVKGKSCHGSAPWMGVDALTAAAHILLALQEISARELTPGMSAVLTVGALQAGKAGNVIADFAELNGTLRAFDEGVREKVKKRMEGISKSVAKAFRASATVKYDGGCPSLWNDEKLSILAFEAAKERFGEERVYTSETLGGGAKERSGGSEDFAYISRKVPSIMVAIGAGEEGKGYEYPLHHAKVKFDEKALLTGAALYAHIAIRYFEKE